MKESSDQPKSKGGKRSWKQIKKRKSHKPPKVVETPVGPIDIETMRAEQLPPIIRRAHEHASKGYPLYTVAEMLAEEFSIKPPSEASISRWFKEASAAFLADIRGFRAQRAFQILNESVAMRQRFLPMAMDDEMRVQRYKMEDGERVPYLDEDALPEQAKAAEVVIKCQAVEMEVLGLKGGEGLAEAKEGGQTINDLFAFIGKMAAQHIQGQTPTAHDGNLAAMPVLELRSGVEHLYQETNEQQHA